MSEFAERLPWRLAALAGLLIGAVSFIAGTDPLDCLRRVGMTFPLFWVLGFGLRALLRHGLTPPAPKAKPPPEKTAAAEEPGSHVDEKTPEMTVDDL